MAQVCAPAGTALGELFTQSSRGAQVDRLAVDDHAIHIGGIVDRHQFVDDIDQDLVRIAFELFAKPTRARLDVQELITLNQRRAFHRAGRQDDLIGARVDQVP